MLKQVGFFLSLLFCSLAITAQPSNKEHNLPIELTGGLRVQKTQKLYWENGFTLDFASSKIINSHLHLGLTYVTSRLGSAIGSNAIKQDNLLLNVGYVFRDQKSLQPYTRMNIGFFHADYEAAIFDVLPNKALMFSLEAGLSYKLNLPLTMMLGLGYNLNTGTGTSGPGSLYPVYYQLSVFYPIFKQK